MQQLGPLPLQQLGWLLQLVVGWWSRRMFERESQEMKSTLTELSLVIGTCQRQCRVAPILSISTYRALLSSLIFLSLSLVSNLAPICQYISTHRILKHRISINKIAWHAARVSHNNIPYILYVCSDHSLQNKLVQMLSERRSSKVPSRTRESKNRIPQLEKPKLIYEATLYILFVIL